MRRLLQWFVLGALCCAPQGAARAGDAPDMSWFEQARFGMFVHWGPVSLKGTEIGWSRGEAVPIGEYDVLYREFRAERFDAAQWVGVARAAGMKYLVLTAKHHDGFCLWDSAQTDYDVMATPFRRDVLAELAAECARQGLRFGVYYSILDWRHPDYPTGSPGGRGRKPAPDMERYVAYVKNQLAEILERCRPVSLLWFDGQWEEPWTEARGADLYAFLKKLEPGLIINNRVGNGRAGTEATAPGDYDTPEQVIGAFNRERPWESCMTLCRQWAWKPDDEMKSRAECLRALVLAAGGDGNLLLNVGPMPDGRIEERQAGRLGEMGAWLGRHGEAVYGTRGGPYRPGPWGASTCRGERVFLFVMRWPEEGPLLLPRLALAVVKARLQDGGEASIKATESGLEVFVPEGARDPVVTVIELTLAGDAFAVPPLDVPRPPSGSLAFGLPALASNVFRDMAEYAPEKALDDDPETRWATDAGTHEAWLEVDLGEPRHVARAVIEEGGWDRVRRFKLLVDDGGSWRTVAEGERLGARAELAFAPLRARRVRLEILEAVEGPTIHEVQLFGE
ncbi:MAG: alpha-L-fucosidase [Planctomycetes bacterium]|nr:alpha-L-fucosidase [Planctomycetota bacterium]